MKIKIGILTQELRSLRKQERKQRNLPLHNLKPIALLIKFSSEEISPRPCSTKHIQKC